ncbi:MAG: HTH domain-containing protein [Saprospiraceae bacterium]|nr:HTH domain-containing protein [Saprospiraceae bacterium]
MQWLRGKLNVRYDIEGQGGDPRREIWEIPETVFKESIINALSHRDYYDKGSVTNIEVFNNRVEISNPGGLVSAIPEAEFGKRSHSRNPLIFGLFARMHLVEQVGSGIGRIRELMKEAALPEPVFQKEGIFTVTLSRADIFPGQPPQKSSVKSSVKIIAFISQNRRITIPELAEKLGVTTRAIEKQIANLKKEGKLERQGPDKGGFWKVIDQEPS